jgi:hypothetical protein
LMPVAESAANAFNVTPQMVTDFAPSVTPALPTVCRAK